jgi:2-hydroxychromene-2-carboxylate isomerase
MAKVDDRGRRPGRVDEFIARRHVAGTAEDEGMAEIEYFYSVQSAFAYLGSTRFMTIAKAARRRIAPRPIDLRRVVAEAGSVPFGKRSKAHAAYFFGREIERWSEARGAPTVPGIPTHHAKDPALANGMLIAGLGSGIDIDRLAHAMLEAHWRDDADLADRPTLAAIGRAVGIDPEPLLDRAFSPEARQVYQANTDEAIRRSVFGSPTYVVDGDMFYGQDRLEMVARALDRPYPTKWSNVEAPRRP